IVVVADSALPADGPVEPTVDAPADGDPRRLSGVGEWLAREVEQRTGQEARTTVLGHIQRGGTPSPFDRWLATRFGLHAIDAVHDRAWGTMVALHGTEVARVSLRAATSRLKTVDPRLYAEAGVFFG